LLFSRCGRLPEMSSRNVDKVKEGSLSLEIQGLL